MLYPVGLIGAVFSILTAFLGVNNYFGIAILVSWFAIFWLLWMAIVKNRTPSSYKWLISVVLAILVASLFTFDIIANYKYTILSFLMLIFTTDILFTLKMNPNKNFLEQSLGMSIYNHEMLLLIDVWHQRHAFIDYDRDDYPIANLREYADEVIRKSGVKDPEERIKQVNVLIDETYLDVIKWMDRQSKFPSVVKRYLKDKKSTFKTMRYVLKEAQVQKVKITPENRVMLQDLMIGILDDLYNIKKRLELEKNGDIGEKYEQTNAHIASMLSKLNK